MLLVQHRPDVPHVVLSSMFFRHPALSESATQQTTPPSTEYVAPVVQDESSLRRKANVFAISSGFANLLSGMLAYVFVTGRSVVPASSSSLFSIGVSTGPLCSRKRIVLGPIIHERYHLRSNGVHPDPLPAHLLGRRPRQTDDSMLTDTVSADSWSTH